MKRLVIILLGIFLAACGTSMDPFVGMEQAEQQRQYYASQLTATADVKVFAITSTAAAWNFAQTQTAYPYTATALSYSPTPVPTATPNAAATLIMANAIAESTKVANEVELSNLHVERTRITNRVRAMSAYVIGFVVLIITVLFAVTWSKRLSMVPTPIHDGTGKPLPMLNVVDGTLVDIDRAPNGVMRADKKYLKLLPEITAERQDRVTATAQLVDGKSRAKVTSAAVRELLRSQGLQFLPDGNPETQLAAAAGLMDANFPLPSWDLLAGYPFQPKQAFPYGGRPQELALIDINENPHLAVIGPTGVGKSRYLLRPLICSALASGHQVVIIGEMVDYSVFQVHPNVTLVPVNDVTQEEEAKQYVGGLRVILNEMNSRWQKLTERGVSTWDQAGGVNTLIVLDELGVAIELLELSEANRQHARWAKAILSALVKKGRKAGFNIAISSQRAVGLKNLLSQVEKFVFRVNDADEEKYAFGRAGFGSTDLEKGYFISKVGGRMQVAGAFNPSDQQIGDFLLSHRDGQLEKPKWIEGIFSDANLIEPTDQLGDGESLPAVKAVDEIAQLAESIRGKWSPGMSKRAMAQLLGYPQYGGAYAGKVDRVLNYLTATTTTAQNSPEMGNFEPVVA